VREENHEGEGSRVEIGNSIVVVVALLALAIVVGLYLPAYLTRRAMVDVVRRFYQQNALSAKSAKTADELGLTPPSFIQKMMRRRDYKPEALRVLQQTGGVQFTEDGKLYLAELNLHDSLKGEKNLRS
jgi:hypothetical protein